MLIRAVESSTAEELKEAAAESGRSVQAEARQILDAWAAGRRRRRDFWERAREFRRRVGPVPGNSAEDIREDRDTDHGRDDSGYRT
jgi:plasmid stability protein